jgi:hypothetical protein
MGEVNGVTLISLVPLRGSAVRTVTAQYAPVNNAAAGDFSDDAYRHLFNLGGLSAVIHRDELWVANSAGGSAACSAGADLTGRLGGPVWPAHTLRTLEIEISFLGVPCIKINGLNADFSRPRPAEETENHPAPACRMASIPAASMMFLGASGNPFFNDNFAGVMASLGFTFTPPADTREEEVHAPVVVPHASPPPAGPPAECLPGAYTVLSNSWRRIENGPDANAGHCDNGLSAGLFRFVDGDNNFLLESVPPFRACGTDAPAWLTGGLPCEADGAVKRTVCYNDVGLYGASGTCHTKADIMVRNCGAFYVYGLLAGTPFGIGAPASTLSPTGQCNLGYCTTSATPAQVCSVYCNGIVSSPPPSPSPLPSPSPPPPPPPPSPSPVVLYAHLKCHPAYRYCLAEEITTAGLQSVYCYGSTSGCLWNSNACAQDSDCAQYTSSSTQKYGVDWPASYCADPARANSWPFAACGHLLTAPPPPSPPPSPPVEVLVFSHRVSGANVEQEYFSSAAEGLSSSGDVTAATHKLSRLSELESLRRADSKLQFRLVYPLLAAPNALSFAQSSNPTSSRVVTGYTPLDIPDALTGSATYQNAGVGRRPSPDAQRRSIRLGRQLQRLLRLVCPRLAQRPIRVGGRVRHPSHSGGDGPELGAAVRYVLIAARCVPPADFRRPSFCVVLSPRSRRQEITATVM